MALPPPFAPGRPPPPPPALYQWILLCATSFSNCASVGDGSPPLKPRMDMTLLPLPSWSGAALIEPFVAAAHVNEEPLDFSRATSDELAVWPPPAPPLPEPLGGAPRPKPRAPWGGVPPPGKPPPSPPRDAVATPAGPDAGVDPACAVAAVASVQAPVPARRATATSAAVMPLAARPRRPSCGSSTSSAAAIAAPTITTRS